MSRSSFRLSRISSLAPILLAIAGVTSCDQGITLDGGKYSRIFVVGRVVDASGVPVEGAGVRISNRMVGCTGDRAMQLSMTTGANGSFRDQLVMMGGGPCVTVETTPPAGRTLRPDSLSFPNPNYRFDEPFDSLRAELTLRAP